ncbi:TPA: derepression protein [Salmonella enterica subsp. enterica serovar Concord]|nr:derepression protein [Salmonella enterica subsp. enterica serovar Concord]
MANRRPSRAQVARTHTQTEINRRLGRAHTLAYYLPCYLQRMPADITPLWLPSVLDYIADDLQEVHDLFNEKKHSI